MMESLNVPAATVAFSMAGVLVYLGGTIIKLVHEMIHVMVGWPFL